MLLGLHSNLFPTNLKATTASIAYNFGLALSDSLRSPTKSAGRAAQQLSYDRNTKVYNDPQVGGAELKNYNENYFVNQIEKLVDLAPAFEDEASAISVLDSAILVLDDQRLKDLMFSQ